MKNPLGGKNCRGDDLKIHANTIFNSRGGLDDRIWRFVSDSLNGAVAHYLVGPLLHNSDRAMVPEMA